MQTNIEDINQIEQRMAELRKELSKSEMRMSDLVDEMKTEKQPTTKAEHIANIISKSIAFADSAYFGWKMYRRFGNILSFGNKKKRK